MALFEPENKQVNGLRIGNGFDIHRVSDSASSAGGPLHLAGLKWEGFPPLAGHSDGDCAAHAIADALLSAANLGDIGSFIGVDKPEFEGAHAEKILSYLKEYLNEKNVKIINVSLQILCEAPNISERRREAEAALSELLSAPVSVSGTTAEKIGLIGEQKAIAAYAVALICV